jgi:hypothetical protein
MPRRSADAGSAKIVRLVCWRWRGRHMGPTRPRGRPVDGGGVWLVLPEGPLRCRLAPAVGEDHREVRDDERASDRDRGEPPEMVDEHQDGRSEADRPDAHHDEVAALAVRDVRRQARTRFSDQVGLVTAGSSGGFHISTLCRCQPRRQRWVLHSVAAGYRTPSATDAAGSRAAGAPPWRTPGLRLVCRS